MWQPQAFYSNYVLRTPVILTGAEAVRGFFNYPASRIAVICGNSFSDEKIFRASFSKKAIKFFKRSWNGEPYISGLSGTIAELEKFRPDTIIAVGGGSVIDGSKLCRLFYEFPYYDQGETRISGEFFKTKFIAVPTTVGSGAEISSAAVFWNEAKHRKDMIVIHELQPEVIVYDKRYVENTPLKILIASVLDAMAHMVEGYVSNQNNDFVEMMAENGFEVLVGELEKISEVDNKNIDYKRLQYAGYIGGIVQNHCIVGAAHAIAHQLTEYGYSHGESVSLLLPAVVKVNLTDPVTEKKYVQILSKGVFNGVDDYLTFIDRLCYLSGISSRKASLVSLLNDLSKNSVFIENVKNDRGGKGNPMEISDEYIEKVIRSI